MARNCSSCFRPLDDNTKFCPFCGAKNEIPAPVTPSDEAVTVAADYYAPDQAHSDPFAPQPAPATTNEIHFTDPVPENPAGDQYWNQPPVQQNYYPVNDPAPQQNYYPVNDPASQQNYYPAPDPSGYQNSPYPPYQPEPQRSGSKKWLIIGIVAGVVVFGIVIALIFILSGSKDTTRLPADGTAAITVTEEPTDPPTEPPTDPPTEAIDEIVGTYELITFISDGTDYSSYISYLGESSLKIYSDSTAVMVLNDDSIALKVDAERQTMTDNTGDTIYYTYDGSVIHIDDDGTTMEFRRK